MAKAAMLRMGIAVVAAALSAFVIGPAYGDEDAGKSGFSAAAQLSNRADDTDGPDRQAAPQASLQWISSDGYYATTVLSKTSWQQQTLALNANLIAGRRLRFGDTVLDMHASLMRADDPLVRDTPNYEAVAMLSQKMGVVTVSAVGGNALQPGLYGRDWYGTALVRVRVSDWVSLSSGYGCRWQNGTDRMHWDVGATAVWNVLSLDVRYSANDVSGSETGRPLFVGTHGGVTALLTYNLKKWF